MAKRNEDSVTGTVTKPWAGRSGLFIPAEETDCSLSILLPTLCTYLIKNYHNSHLKPHTLKMSVMHN